MRKNGLLLIFLMLAGLVLGGFLADITDSVPFLSWLSYGMTFGPASLTLPVMHLSFSLTLNISSIIGIAGAILLYRKI